MLVVTPASTVDHGDDRWQPDFDVGAVVAQQVGLTEAIETRGVGIWIDHVPGAGLARDDPWERVRQPCAGVHQRAQHGRCHHAMVELRNFGARDAADRVGEACELDRLDVLVRKVRVVDRQCKHCRPLA